MPKFEFDDESDEGSNFGRFRSNSECLYCTG